MKLNYLSLILLFILSCSKNKTTKNDISLSNAFYDKAFEFLDHKNKDSAFYYFNLSKDSFSTDQDTIGIAKCLINMAVIQESEGDDYGSQETSVEALKYLNKKRKNNYYLAATYNNLGIVSGKLKMFENSINFFNDAIKYTDDEENSLIYENNLANEYRRKQNYIDAIKIYKVILRSNLNIGNYARTLTNLAFTQWLQNPNYNPLPEFQNALKIRMKEKDQWGLNSSYAHIADYYTPNNQDSALVYAKKMFQVAKEIKSPDDQIEALQKLIVLENSQNSKEYFQIYQKLNDSLQTARNKAKNQFALIRYETEKNKADFLKAQAESAQRQNHIIKQYILIGIIALILLILIISFTKRQKKLQQEKLLEVKNTELKYSKKVHDRVANRIYQLMSFLENKAYFDRDALLFGLENVYEISRDISYDNKDINENQSFSEQLHLMLASYSSESIKTILNGNNERLWEGVSFRHKTEVYLIVQELMTNMRKHSQASVVSIIFLRTDHHISISYTDNGIGIAHLSPKKGLQNVENRIKSINGTVTFDTENNSLLKINITFPV